MFEKWAQRVGSAVPRGFSRYYILQQLQKMPHTGKEIIDSAIEESAGEWKPSPGLIYPLLGRLLDEGLIEESENGKYQITDKGQTTLEDLESFNKEYEKTDGYNDANDQYWQIHGNGCFERVTILGNLLAQMYQV